MIACSKCGRKTPEGVFCSRCGAELVADAPSSEPVVPAADAAGMPAIGDEASAERQERVEIRTETDSAVPDRAERCAFQVMNERLRAVDDQLRRSAAEIESRTERMEPIFELDRSCPLFENMTGTLRFRFALNGSCGTVENVSVVFSNCGCEKESVKSIPRVSRVQEFSVQFPPQPAGMQSWNISLEFVSSRRRHKFTGDFQVMVRPVESRRRGSDNFNIKIETNIGDVSQASDVVVNQRGVDELAKLIAANDPFEEMKRAFTSDRREWAAVQLVSADTVADLPPMPAAAQTDRIALNTGSGRIYFFAARTVKFWRRRETNDIVLRPAEGADEGLTLAYRKISREHCFFEHSGANVLLQDGSRGGSGAVQPSSGGTYWNGGRLHGPVELPIGTIGTVSFCEAACTESLSLSLKVCAPKAACATCPHADVRWCGDGRRPSLMLTRRDGVPEKFIGLWSCFSLWEADPSFDGVVIFRKNGAFAYRCSDGHSGWLTPGTSVQMNFGFIKVD